MKNFDTILLAALAALALSCRPEELPEYGSGRFQNLDGVPHEMIVLGDRLNDPYSLEVMQAAYSKLYPDTKGGLERLDATDYYVRFLPENDAQYTLLGRMGIEILDHPLDYEIIKEGDYYHDPSVGEDRITWQYAVVDSDFAFPKGLKYEILDQCYIPSDQATKAAGVDWDAVEREAFRISGNAGMLAPATKAADGGSPCGTILIQDANYNGGQPLGVAGVKVSVNSFVKFASAYTDAEGNYSINKQFAGKIRYRMVFSNVKGFGIGVNLLLVPASVSTLGSGPATGMDILINTRSDRKLYTRSVANNAAYDYYERCAREDVKVTQPPADLRIWLFHNIGSSSAPMLQHGTFIDSSVLGSFLGEYSDILKVFLPDLTIGVKDLYDYGTLYSLVQHELAHSSHFTRVGTAFWDKYIRHVLKSFVTSGFRVYGVGTEADAGYCEVGEMWAYYLQNVLFREKFGYYPSNVGTSYWFFPQILLYMDDRGLDDSSIFTALGPDAIDRDSLQAALLELYPQKKYIINQAFNRYLN